MLKNRTAGSIRPQTPGPATFHYGAMRFLQVMTLVLVVGWIYWPALRGAWLWDDVTEITGNRLVHDPAGLAKI